MGVVQPLNVGEADATGIFRILKASWGISSG